MISPVLENQSIAIKATTGEINESEANEVQLDADFKFEWHSHRFTRPPKFSLASSLNPQPYRMKTELPDLPFKYVGRSSARTTTYPRTDLENLKPWTYFSDDVHKAIRKAMTRNNLPSPTQLTVGNAIMEPTIVSSEEFLRGHANSELHSAVKGVLRELSVDGWFTGGGCGNVELVGHPDFADPGIEQIAPQTCSMCNITLLRNDRADHVVCVGGVQDGVGS
jgi:hypothetical protein